MNTIAGAKAAAAKFWWRDNRRGKKCNKKGTKNRFNKTLVESLSFCFFLSNHPARHGRSQIPGPSLDHQLQALVEALPGGVRGQVRRDLLKVLLLGVEVPWLRGQAETLADDAIAGLRGPRRVDGHDLGLGGGAEDHAAREHASHFRRFLFFRFFERVV